MSKAMSTVSQIHTLMDSVSDILAGKWPGSLFCAFILAFRTAGEGGAAGRRARGVVEVVVVLP